ncbi:hypothetical protein AK88_03176 [Plasmodium fragile]|uniref:Deoxyribodipyrimidine photo-lyase n=1 Tax=Plasmodium fragile TaxID=5857 RepID=A0A0D9QJA9_PLAFR|nr:uncharacterized protein AK88_03176 [Plasmodium fragile]KJP87130.1 hypothetical protein AK88_03176 [Plasmodium fragile]
MGTYKAETSNREEGCKPEKLTKLMHELGGKKAEARGTSDLATGKDSAVGSKKEFMERGNASEVTPKGLARSRGVPQNSPAGFSPNSAPRSTPKLASKLAANLTPKLTSKLAPKLGSQLTPTAAPIVAPRNGPAWNRGKFASLRKVSPWTLHGHKSKTNLPSVHPKGSEEKRKRNPYETSREKKMTILAKRIRCLTSFESGTESSGGADAANPKGCASDGGGNVVEPRCSIKEEGTDAIDAISSPTNQVHEQQDTLLLLLTRDFRVNDNWALTYAQEMAKKKGYTLIACTCLNRKEKVTNRFIYTKLKVLKNLENALKQINIPFYILPLYMIDEFSEFIKTHHVKVITCDLHVLHDEKAFIKSLTHLCNKRKVKMVQVDSHNVVPMWVTSKVEECSVRTIKPKIQALLPTFLIEYVSVEPFEQNLKFPDPFDVDEVVSKLTVSNTCAVVPNFVLTENKAQELLSDFCTKALDKYNVKRNDPNSDAGSVLLLYINLGVLSAQRCVLEVHKHAYNNPSIHAVSGKESFSDDFIMRKELADNYCYYNRNYNNFEGGREWAKESLKKHDADKREYLYDYEDFKNANTHNEMWNCCQLQLINEGVMHEFLKVFWAKKILNWSANSQTALKYAIQLNEELSIDGKTPSGYASIMWSIMGVHDQSWNERNVFGKIRFINSNGCKRNFDMNMFVLKYPKGKENASIVKKIPTITFASYLKKRKNGPATPLQEPTRKMHIKGPVR